MWGQLYDVQFFHPQSNSHLMLSVDFRMPKQSPRACRSLAKLNAASKCRSGVREAPRRLRITVYAVLLGSELLQRI